MGFKRSKRPPRFQSDAVRGKYSLANTAMSASMSAAEAFPALTKIGVAIADAGVTHGKSPRRVHRLRPAEAPGGF
jgi:hypothetical protein